MKLLELFAGSRSIGKVAEKLNFEVFSSDLNNFEDIDYVVDILEFDVKRVPFHPTVVWASPPCTTYSLSAISHHRPLDGELSEFAIKSDKIVKKTLQIIKHFDPKFWYIENPRGVLRKQNFMSGLPRTTVWYCRYGDTRANPTDIWSNNIYSLFNQSGWVPRARCFNNNKNCHHEEAPRGSQTGTQGLKNNYEKSKVPEELCLEILKSSI